MFSFKRFHFIYKVIRKGLLYFSEFDGEIQVPNWGSCILSFEVCKSHPLQVIAVMDKEHHLYDPVWTNNSKDAKVSTGWV